ncbi:unnamed protein product [marine sediment metagenome]|uniref:Uncharacterized protein n=2 Tax=marine sediment metagenome TaxID=412755 RepID=X1RN33_9ZZZZ
MGALPNGTGTEKGTVKVPAGDLGGVPPFPSLNPWGTYVKSKNQNHKKRFLSVESQSQRWQLL